jgi:hypothetical protein
MIGCADNRPACCPSLSLPPPTTSTTTVLQLVTESTEVVAALSAAPLNECPADYQQIGTACCPECAPLPGLSLGRLLTRPQWLQLILVQPLQRNPLLLRALCRPPHPRRRDHPNRAPLLRSLDGGIPAADLVRARHRRPGVRAQPGEQAARQEIGRASCRERVLDHV